MMLGYRYNLLEKVMERAYKGDITLKEANKIILDHYTEEEIERWKSYQEELKSNKAS